MKIAFIVHGLTKKRGHDKYTLNIAKGLSREHDVHVFTSMVDSVDVSNMTIHKIPTIGMPIILKIILFYICCGIALKFINRKERFDVVHMQGICAPPAENTIITAHLCAEAYYNACKKYVFSANHLIRRLYYIIYSKFCIFLEKRGYRNKNVRLIIAPSDKIKTELGQYYNVSQEKIVVLYEGVDLEEFKPLHPKSGRIEKILFIGDIQRNNIIGLFEVLKQLQHISLTIIGDIKTNLYRKRVEELNIKERVIFLKPRKDINDILNDHDLFIYPSLYDAFALISLEAMASGLPCILSSKSGICETLKGTGSAVIIDDPLDVNEIKSKIESLSSNPEAVIELSRQAQKAAANYSWDKVASRTLQVYYKIINPAKRILIVSPEYFQATGGVASYLRILALELSKHMEIDVLTTKHTGKTFLEDNENLRIHSLIKNWDIFGFIKIMDFINERDYKLINIQYVPHMYGWNGVNFSLFLFYMWAWFKRRTVFTYCHEQAIPFSFKHWYRLPFAVFNRLLYVYIVFFSKRVGLSVKSWKDRSESVFFWMKRKFIVIPVFSNFKKVDFSKEQKQKIREKLGIEKDEKVLFFLGGLHPSKMIGYVLFTLEQLLKKGYNIKLLCGGFETKNIFNLLKPSQQYLKCKIIATGVVPEEMLVQFLNISDIYLCPYADGISTRRTSAMAGMQSACPVVTTCGYNTDMRLFGNKKSGITLAHNRKEFLKETESLLKDENKRNVLADATRKFYEENFSLKIVADYYIDIFLKNKL